MTYKKEKLDPKSAPPHNAFVTLTLSDLNAHQSTPFAELVFPSQYKSSPYYHNHQFTKEILKTSAINVTETTVATQYSSQ